MPNETDKMVAEATEHIETTLAGLKEPVLVFGAGLQAFAETTSGTEGPEDPGHTPHLKTG
jgi:hypothetical protein